MSKRMSITATDIKLHPSWLSILKDEFELPYMKALKEFLLSEKQKGKVIFPSSKFIFNAFNSTPFNSVKVVYWDKILIMAPIKRMVFASRYNRIFDSLLLY